MQSFLRISQTRFRFDGFITKVQTAVNHIAAACAAAGIQQAIICPGSRNAPLTMAFARHPNIKCHSVVDERSAGFIALGMAQQTQFPVALLCTSGSAVVNFYPAVVEAFYQRVPLLIITADRPPELIDQWDGQTMHQNGVFGKHIKAQYTMPDDYSLPQVFSQTTLAAFSDAVSGLQGPVHINVPLREPLYNAINDTFSYPQVEYKTQQTQAEKHSVDALQQAFASAKRVMIFSGAGKRDEALNNALSQIGQSAAILADVVSNQHSAGNIRHWDFLLAKKEEAITNELKPDLLITTGTSTVSKNLKLFLRKNKPQYHFHISPTGEVADPFQTSPQVVKGDIAQILSQLNRQNQTTHYWQSWNYWDGRIEQLNAQYFSQAPFCEFSSVKQILNSLPAKGQLQLANSMAVRWANLLGVKKELAAVYSNRGVSGIDGCTSTAVGAAYAQPQETVTLITGDVAFFYDSNALWNKFAPANLRIIVLNNSGGGIFRLIDGPGQMAELDEFLATRHQRNARLLCQDMGVEYASANNFEELENELEKFYRPANKPKVLEVFTDTETNTQVFKVYKQLINGLEKI